MYLATELDRLLMPGQGQLTNSLELKLVEFLDAAKTRPKPSVPGSTTRRSPTGFERSEARDMRYRCGRAADRLAPPPQLGDLHLSDEGYLAAAAFAACSISPWICSRAAASLTLRLSNPLSSPAEPSINSRTMSA